MPRINPPVSFSEGAFSENHIKRHLHVPMQRFLWEVTPRLLTWTADLSGGMIFLGSSELFHKEGKLFSSHTMHIFSSVNILSLALDHWKRGFDVDQDSPDLQIVIVGFDNGMRCLLDQ